MPTLRSRVLSASQAAVAICDAEQIGRRLQHDHVAAAAGIGAATEWAES